MKNNNQILTKSVLTVMMLLAINSQSIADDVIQDDLLAVGSFCVGLDCVSGEVFGFDTIRLKENNVRIKFQDTSSSSSFPSNDWQLTANDSTNGGMNYFSIDDVDSGFTPFTVEAGALDNSLFINSSGFVGFGTSTPLVALHALSTDTPSLRFEQDASGGFASQVWDVGGNESNFFVRDVTNGSLLPFRILPNAPSDSISIASDGDIGFQTSTPDGLFDIAHPSDGNNHAFLVSPVGNVGINIDNSYLPNSLFEIQTTGGISLFGVNNSGQVGLGVANVNVAYLLEASNGAHLTTGGVWTNASSRTLKNDITEIDADVALSALKELNPVTFSYKNDPAETYAGFIAEDVPELVATNDRKSLAPMDIVAVLTKVVQQQQQAIEKLQARLTQLENK